jgi:hypothetical protein
LGKPLIIFIIALIQKTRYTEEYAGFKSILGIVITMYFNDHNPLHFHVRYDDYRALVSINDFSMLEGYLPPRILGLVME